MRPAMVTLAVALASIVSGCGTVASLRPLYTEADLDAPATDPRLEGEWVSLSSPDPYEEPFHRLTIAPQVAEPRGFVQRSPGPGNYSVELTPIQGEATDETWLFDLRLVRIGDATFFDAELNVHRVSQGVEVRASEAPFVVGTHVVGLARVEEDFVRLDVLAPTAVKEHLPGSLWNHLGDDDVLITCPTEELRSFLVGHVDDPEAFVTIYLCRPDSECKRRIVDDVLARDPDGVSGLEAGAEYFTASGDHERAIAVRRRVAAIQPHEPRSHANLAEAYLLNRDFAGARKEYAAARALRAVHADVARIPAFGTEVDIAWSYFLEGAYAEVVSTARSNRVSGPLASADLPLLAYYSLIRLGRPKEAIALLTEVTATFLGPSEDQLLLLDAGGRLSDDGAPGAERGVFYRGLREVAAGRTDRAKRHFAAAHPEWHGSRIALAARIELERLERNVP